MDIAAVWVHWHINTHAQHLNIVAITEGKLRHLRQYRVLYQILSGTISHMTFVTIYLFSMPGLGHLLLHTPTLQGGST